MRRRQRIDAPRTQQSLEAAQQLLQGPLRAVGECYAELLTYSRAAVDLGCMNVEQLAAITEAAAGTLRVLPKQYGERFAFDAGLLSGMIRDWSVQPLLAPMLVPCYDDGWGHASVTPPAFVDRKTGEHRVRVIDLILFPGRDNIDDVDLLEYPWVAHELGHNLLFHQDQSFISQMAEALDRRIRALRVASIADRGTARAKAQDVIDEFALLWGPTPDHRNWSHEVAADIIAVYILGPAYLSAFEDLLSSGTTNPYRVGPVHPPYSARVEAITLAASALGWEAYTSSLARIVQGWATGAWAAERTNQMVALVDPELLSATVDVCLRTCSTLGLRRCTPGYLEEVAGFRGELEQIALGIDLLLAAWHMSQRTPPEEFEAWERDAVSQYARSVTL